MNKLVLWSIAFINRFGFSGKLSGSKRISWNMWSLRSSGFHSNSKDSVRLVKIHLMERGQIDWVSVVNWSTWNAPGSRRKWPIRNWPSMNKWQIKSAKLKKIGKVRSQRIRQYHFVEGWTRTETQVISILRGFRRVDGINIIFGLTTCPFNCTSSNVNLMSSEAMNYERFWDIKTDVSALGTLLNWKQLFLEILSF